MAKTILAIFGLLLVSQAVLAGPFHGGYGFGNYGYGGYGYGGIGIVEEIVEPIIPIAGGLVDARSFVDSYIPGSTPCGYGTYGPAYGGGRYPLELFGYPGPFGRGLGYY